MIEKDHLGDWSTEKRLLLVTDVLTRSGEAMILQSQVTLKMAFVQARLSKIMSVSNNNPSQGSSYPADLSQSR